MISRPQQPAGDGAAQKLKPKSSDEQLAAILRHNRVTTIFDVGANEGQYGRKLRRLGFDGRIISFEPLSSAHRALLACTAGDPDWIVAPPMAIGDLDGEVTIQVSAESDMSSILDQNRLMRQISPSSAIEGVEKVPLRRLDGLITSYLGEGDRSFLKIDTQGFEPKVLDGAAELQRRLVGIQLEMSLVPLYENAIDFRAMIDRLASKEFELHLILPGYFERKIARQLEIDGIFIRKEATLP